MNILFVARTYFSIQMQIRPKKVICDEISQVKNEARARFSHSSQSDGPQMYANQCLLPLAALPIFQSGCLEHRRNKFLTGRRIGRPSIVKILGYYRALACFVFFSSFPESENVKPSHLAVIFYFTFPGSINIYEPRIFFIKNYVHEDNMII